MRLAAARALGAVGVVAQLAGCAGGPRLAAAPTVPVNLSGHWIMDAAASDDAAALIRAALPKPKEARRPHYDSWGNETTDGSNSGPSGGGRGGGGRGSRSGRGASNANAPTAAREDPSPVWGRIRPYDYVAYFAVPTTRLDVEQGPGTVRVGYGDRLRAFVPGDEEPVHLTDRFGSRAVKGGWIGDAFAVSSDDGKNLHVLDTLRRTREDGLERVAEVKITSVKTVTVHTHYRRATDAELLSGGEDGPPAPLR